MDLAKLRVLITQEGLQQVNAQLRDFRAQQERNFGELSRTVGLGMTAMGAAIVGGLGLATKSAMTFDSAMRDVGTLGVKDLKALRDGTLKFSVAMGEDKLRAMAATGAEYFVANDAGCLLHLDGLIHRQGLPLKTMHLAELLVKQE